MHKKYNSEEIKEKIEKGILKEVYDYLLTRHSIEESNFILLNSLAILGDKKVSVYYDKEINKFDLERVNRYKYPDRLSSFIRTSSEKTDDWKNYSFSGIACR